MSKIDNEIKEGTPRFKKGDAFVGMAPHPLVYMEVNEVKVSQSYTKENGCKTGGKVGGDVVENIVENITENIVDSIVEKLSTTRAKIVRIIWKNPNATAQSISKEINIASRNVQEHLRKLQEQGVIRRIGPDKGGHWEIIAP